MNCTWFLLAQLPAFAPYFHAYKEAEYILCMISFFSLDGVYVWKGRREKTKTLFCWHVTTEHDMRTFNVVNVTLTKKERH